MELKKIESGEISPVEEGAGNYCAEEGQKIKSASNHFTEPTYN